LCCHSQILTCDICDFHDGEDSSQSHKPEDLDLETWKIYLFSGFLARIAALTDVVGRSDEFHAPYPRFGIDRVMIRDLYRKAGRVAGVFRKSLPQVLSAAPG
jgi:hypothetical protein